MVAVITGNGLGLGNTSLTQLGQAQGGSPNLGQAANSSYLNAASGNLVLQSADEGLLFDGLPLNVLRTYNSLGQLNGNAGWSYGFSRNVSGLTGTLNTAGSTITRTADDGSSVVYTYNATLGVYTSTAQSGAIDSLSWNATSFTWTWTAAAANQTETYNANGQLTALTDTATGASYSFSYNNNQLSQIVAGDGDTLIFGYNASNQLISLSIQEVPPGQTMAVTRQAVTYGYDTQGRLSTVTTTLGSDTDSTTSSYTTTYTYQGTTDLVASVTQSDGTTVSYSYDGSNQVATITTGSGAAAQTTTIAYSDGSTSLTDAMGNTTTYTYTASGYLEMVTDPYNSGPIPGVPTTVYGYDANGNLLSVQNLNTGASTNYTYDANGNLLSVEQLGTQNDPETTAPIAGNTVSYTYNADDQVTSKTIYTVPALGTPGEDGYVGPSGAETTYYAYNVNDQLAYTITPFGNVSENDYTTVNGLNELTTTRQYLGATYDLNDASTSNPPTLADLQAWVQSSAVQSTLSQSTRTDYTYDVRGQLAMQTQYDTVNSSGVGVVDTGTVITTTTYDAQGRLLQTSTETGANRSTLQITSYTYDGLGRLISKSDPLGNVTSYVYTDSANTIAITQANGLTITQVRNSAGQLISSTQLAAGQTSRTTSYVYDADGQQVAVIDPEGNVTYTFYDVDGRVAGTVNPYGNATVYYRDGAGNIIQTIQFAAEMYTGNWLAGGSLTSNAPITDFVTQAVLTQEDVYGSSLSNCRITNTFYNAENQVIATIDPELNVTTYAYDAVGNQISKTQYATPLTSSQDEPIGYWSGLKDLLIASPSDRTTLSVYDADDRLVATVDAGGYVTTYGYNGLGEVTAQTMYATPLNTTQISALGDNPTLAEVMVKVVPGAKDQVARTYYDGLGREDAQIDGDGYLMTIAYDETTDITTTTHYVAALSAGELAALTGNETVASLVGLLGVDAQYEQTSHGYDPDGRLSSSTATDGTITSYTYNAAGQILSTTVTPASGQGTALTTSATYNAFGGELTSTDANGATTTYAYNTLGQNVEVTDADGNSTWYLYDVGGHLSFRVQGQAVDGVLNAIGDVSAYRYGYFSQMSVAVNYTVPISLTSIDFTTTQDLTIQQSWASVIQPALAAAGNPGVFGKDADVKEYTYTLDGQVASETNNLLSYGGGYQNVYTYDAFGDLIQSQQQTSEAGQSVTSSNSDTTINVYDALGNVVASIDPSGDVAIDTYDNAGDVTSRTVHAAPLTSSQVATLGSSPTLAAVEAVLTLSASDQTTISIYDEIHQVVATVDPDGTVQTITYDENGNVAAETVYPTRLTAAQIQSLGTTPTMSSLLSLLNQIGATSWMIYNVSSQKVAEVNADGAASYTFYNAQGQVDGTVNSNGDVTAYVYNANGQITQTTQYATPVSTAGWLSNGAITSSFPGVLPIPASSSGDLITTKIYDSNGNVLATIAPNGSVVQNIYNSSGDIASSTAYAAPLTAQNMSELGSDPSLSALQNVLVTSSSDQTTFTIYNTSGQVFATVSASGSVVLDDYDASGNRIQTVAVSTSLTAAQLQALASNPTMTLLQGDLAANQGAQSTLTIYNQNNQVVATVSPSGSVTTTTYDAEGNVLAVINYGTPLTPSELVSLGDAPTLAELQPYLTANSNNATSLTIYDANGNPSASITPTQFVNPSGFGGVVTTTTYDASGNLLASTRYANYITPSEMESLGSTPTLAALQQFLTTSVNDQITINILDAKGNVIARGVPSYGYVYALNGSGDGVSFTTYTYNDVGQAVASTKYGSLLSIAQAEQLSNNPTISELNTLLTSGYGDQTNVTVYDANGGQVATVTPTYGYSSTLGYWGDLLEMVTTYNYDANGNVIATFQYANPLTDAQAEQLAQDPTVATLTQLLIGNTATQTQTRFYVYSSDNTEQAAVTYVSEYDSSTESDENYGQVTLSTSNASGYFTGQTQYATLLTPTQLEALGSDPTFQQVAAEVTPTIGDQTSQWIYNSSGELLATITPQYESVGGESGYGGQVTVYTYDLSGNQASETQYATLLTSAQVASLGRSPTMAQLDAMLQPSASDQINLTIRSSDGSMIANIGLTEVSYDATTEQEIYGGQVTVSLYDALGNYLGQARFGALLSIGQLRQLAQTPTWSALQSQLAMNPDVAIYNADGSIAASVNSNGDVTLVSYNYGTTTTFQYGSILTLEQVESFTNTPTLSALMAILPAESDQGGTTILGASGQVLGQVSSSGIVTLMTYDAAGNEIAATQYSTPLNFRQMSDLAWSPSIQALQIDLEVAEGDSVNQTLYNAAGQAIATISSNGNVTTTTYDANGNAIAVTEYSTPLNTPVSYVASYAQLLSELTPSSDDVTTRTIYNAENQPVATIDGGGNVTITSYNSAGNVISSSKYATPLTSKQLAELGDAPTLATLDTLLASTTSTIYNAAGLAIATVNAAGNASYTFYNANGWVVGTVDADGNVTAYAYDADGRVTQATQYATPISGVSSWITNGALTANYPVSLPLPNGSSNDRTTTTIYDADGNVVATIAPAGDVTANTYDASGDVTSTTRYATPLTSQQLATLGIAPTLAKLQSLLVSSSSDRTERTIYDAEGKVLATIDASGYVTATTYNLDGDAVSQSAYATALTPAQLVGLGDTPTLAALQADLTPSGQDQTTHSYYDGLGRVVAQIDADGYLTTSTYSDSVNTIVTTRYATALTTDQLNALTGSESVATLVGLLGSNTANEQSSVIYNAEGQVASSTAVDGTVTTYTYNGAGQVLSATVTPVSGQGEARTTSATYDAFGDELSVTDATGATTTYVYNALGQKIEATDAVGNSTWYYYDADGKLLYTIQGQPNEYSGAINGFGNVTAFTYDAFGEVTLTKTYAVQLTLTTGISDGSTLNASTASIAEVIAAINALGTASGDADAVTRTTYTADGRVATIIDGDGYETADSYDGFGDLAQTQQQISQPNQALTSTDSTITDYAYDSRGEQLSETDGVGSNVARSTSTTYDAFGRATSTTDGNGNTISYAYDNLGRQVSSSQIVQGVARTTQTTYDAFSHVLTQTDALGNVTTYQYDVATQTTIMTAPGGVTMTTVKDAFGDVLSVTDGAGNTTTYTYDADGRLLTTTDALGNASKNSYDADGNLSETTDATGHVVDYYYDASGRVVYT